MSMVRLLDTFDVQCVSNYMASVHTRLVANTIMMMFLPINVYVATLPFHKHSLGCAECKPLSWRTGDHCHVTVECA